MKRGRRGAAAALRQRQQEPARIGLVPQQPQITDDARRWIAENLMLGHPANVIAAQLQQSGCPLDLALAEIAAAQASPYFRGAHVLQQRLAKRDWLLASYGRLAALDGGLNAVPVVHRLPAEAFFRDFYAMHRPVLIKGLMDDWPATRLWSLDYFDERLGQAEIEVQTHRESNPAYEQQSPNHKQLARFAEVIERLRTCGRTNDFYVTANNTGINRRALAPLWEDVGPIPGYLDPSSDRDGYIWIGPAGTITPFHHDLTNNLLVQISGTKRVTLLPSWETPRMRNAQHCFSQWRSPAEIAALPAGERPAMMTCDIGPGDALFIPVGWWHYVEGLDVTIGMSFTNFTRENDFFTSYTTYDQV